MKMLHNASNNLSLLYVKVKEEGDTRNEVVNIYANYSEMFQDSQEV